MNLKYACPSCGTPLGYQGLCWKCKCEQERQAALAWTLEQIAEKQRNLIQNIQRLADMEDPEFTDLPSRGMKRQWRHCWSWSGIPGPGARASMWTRPAMRRLAAGPSTRRARESNLTLTPAIPWSREPAVRSLPSALAGHGRTHAPTVADA